MSGFVSSPPQQQPEGAVTHDGWYPGVDLTLLRDTMRIPTQVTTARLTAAAAGAMLSVSRELAAWRALQSADNLAGVEAAQLAGRSVLVHLYERAVYSFAAADLAETHSDITATSKSDDRADARVLAADDHRRNATHAIRDILGVGRTAVELI